MLIVDMQVPYFCLPADDLTDVIAPSCYRSLISSWIILCSNLPHWCFCGRIHHIWHTWLPEFWKIGISVTICDESEALSFFLGITCFLSCGGGLQLLWLYKWPGSKPPLPFVSFAWSQQSALSIAGCRSLCVRQFLGLFMIESISNDKVCLWKQDLVVGYMGVPKYAGVPMTKHPQYITVRWLIKNPPVSHLLFQMFPDEVDLHF
jgi:hypothetical protein